MRRIWGILALGAAPLCIALVAAWGAAAAQDAVPASPLFADRTPLSLRITGPFRQLARDGEDRLEHDAVVEVTGAEGQTLAIGVELRVRGKSRAKHCRFKPLSVDFPRSEVAGTVFAGQNQLKLVTLCERKDTYRDYLALEFQLYGLFSALTERSFRVRWAQVEFIDTDPRRPESVTEPAFFIESEQELAGRHRLDVIEQDRLSLSSLDPAHTALVTLFQYLIANTDWDATMGPAGEDCCHNYKVMGIEGQPLFIVPYDFDQSGLINTEYAVPSELLGIRSVTQRVYRGYCLMNDRVDPVIALLNERREELRNVLAGGRASSRARERAGEFLAESFERINDEEQRQSDIIEECRR